MSIHSFIRGCPEMSRKTLEGRHGGKIFHEFKWVIEGVGKDISDKFRETPKMREV
jgi:hypothetical protein